MATIRGRVMLVRDTSAGPDARPGTMPHCPLSRPLIDLRRRSTTDASEILVQHEVVEQPEYLIG
jgi:hypothetical protein